MRTTATEMAGEFCEMHAADMARFFSELARLTQLTQGNGMVDLQFGIMSRSDLLTNEARDLVALIYKHSEQNRKQ